jgi:putative membrane protein insertion efficiency factor
MRKILTYPFLGLIYVYKYMISPLLPRGCRHYPSCSVYSIEALEKYGLIKGGEMAINRISRCQPWGTSGYDPVPKFIIKKADLKKYNTGTPSLPHCDRLKHH